MVEWTYSVDDLAVTSHRRLRTKGSGTATSPYVVKDITQTEDKVQGLTGSGVGLD